MRRKDVEDKLIGHIRPSTPDILFVLFDEIRTGTVRSSGLILPPMASLEAGQSNLRIATVISIGKNIRELKPGDRVIIRKGYGNRMPGFDYENLMFLSECQVEAVVTGDVECDDFDMSTHELSL